VNAPRRPPPSKAKIAFCVSSDRVLSLCSCDESGAELRMTDAGPQRIDVAPSQEAVEAAVKQLPLADRTRTLVVNGGTVDDPSWPTANVKAALRAAVVELAAMPGPVIVSGGTHAGLFAVLGEVVAETAFAGLVIGVAPAGRIDGGHHTPLEPHHSHALVVDVPSWGDEIPALMTIVRLLRRRGPVVALISGGGKQTITEVQGHLAAQTPVIALRGTGRATDDLTRAPGRDGLIVVDVTDPGAVAAAVREKLQPHSADKR
jgi:SLOG in TRPM, prokaryote